MTLKQFYQQHDNKMIIVYIKNDEEVYKITDLDYDDLDDYIVLQSSDIGWCLYFLVVQKKEDKLSIERDKLKQRISEMHDELRNLTNKWLEFNCFSTTCTDCPFNGKDKSYHVPTYDATPCKHAVLRLNTLKAFRDAVKEITNENK